MTHPPTDPSGARGAWGQHQQWERIRRERRRVTFVSVAIVAAAIAASVLIVALGTGGDDGTPAASSSTSATTPAATGPSGSPEEVVAAYIEALKKADVDAAIEVTCGGLYQEAVNAKEQDLGVSDDFSDLQAPATKTEDPSFDTPVPAKLVWVDWKLGSDTTDRIFLTMVVNDEWKACEVGNDSDPPDAGSTEAVESTTSGGDQADSG